jgi:TP901 family phage tail tape measure protein
LANEEELGSMIIRVGLDGSDMDRSLKGINQRLNATRSELKATASTFDDFGGSVDGLRAKQENLSRQQQLQGEKVKQLKRQYDDLVRVHGAESEAALRAASRLNQATATYNNMGRTLETVGDQINNLTDELERQNSILGRSERALTSFSERAGTAGQSLSAFGTGLTAGVTVPLMALGGLALKAASDMDKALGRIQAQTGYTAEYAKELQGAARDLWKNGFGADVAEAAESVTLVTNTLGELGGTAKDIQKVTEAAYVLQDAFGFEIASSTGAAKQLMINFGVSAEAAMDMFTVAAQNGGNYADDLLDTVSEYSPHFKALGYDAEGMMATLIAGAQSGAFNLDILADAAKESFIIMSSGSDDAKDALTSMGLDANQVIKDINSGGEGAQKAFMAVSTAIASIEDPTKRNTAAIAAFGTPLEDLGPEFQAFFSNVSKDLGDFEGATKKAGEALYDNLGDRATSELRKLADSLLPLGEILLDIIEPAFEATSEKIEEFTSWMKTLSPEAQKTILAVAGIVAAIGPLAIGLGAVISGLGAVSGALALLTNPIGLTVLALAGLGLGFAALDSAMDKPILKSDLFAGEISKATEKAVGSYMKLDDEATAELNSLAWSQATITQAMSDDMVAKYQAMGDQVLLAMQQNHADQLAEQQSLFDRSAVLTEEEEAKRIAKLKADQLAEVEAHNANQARVKEIWTTAANEKRGITEAESVELAQLQEAQRIKAVEELSKSQLEQETILNNLKTNKEIIEAETAANTVNKSIETRDKVVKEANQQYNETVAKAEEGRDVLGTVSAEEATAIIEEAERKKNEVVAKAQDMHTNVISEARKQAGEHVDEVNWETGEVLAGYDSMYNGVIDAVNWVRELFGKGPLKKKGTVSENGRQRLQRQNASISGNYANGTPSSGHPGGLAVVSELGSELIHEPGVGTYLSGSNGPELRNLKRGTSVLPHRQTERLLKSYGFPGYAGGIGDFFDSFLKGTDSAWEMLKGKFSLSDSVIPSWINNHTGSPLSYIGDMAKGWVKDLVGDMGTLGGSFSGGGADMARAAIIQALGITGKPMSWLNPMMTIAQRESGFNPRAINLWDSNAKKGIPSKGMFQTIDPTFNAYKMAGLNDIYNPVHNAVAAIRYMDSRYGGIWGHPGVQSMAGGGGYKPYARGGEINYKQLALLGENGYKEWVLTSEPRYRNNNLSMWMEAGQAMGVPVIPSTPAASGGSGVIASPSPSNLPVNSVQKQPLIIQMVTPDERIMAEWLVDDITEMQEFKANRIKVFEGGR